MATLGLSILDMVNRMLQSIGERPVAALDTGGSSVEADAERVLNSTHKTLAGYGWPENTRFFETFTADGSTGQVVLAEDTLHMWASGRSEFRLLVIVGDRIYDNNDLTFNLGPGTEVTIDRILDLGLVNFSPKYKELVAATATVYFQQQVRGSATQDAFLRQAQALADVMAARNQSRLGQRPINLKPLVEFMQPLVGGGGGRGG